MSKKQNSRLRHCWWIYLLMDSRLASLYFVPLKRFLGEMVKIGIVIAMRPLCTSGCCLNGFFFLAENQGTRITQAITSGKYAFLFAIASVQRNNRTSPAVLKTLPPYFGNKRSLLINASFLFYFTGAFLWHSLCTRLRCRLDPKILWMPVSLSWTGMRGTYHEPNTNALVISLMQMSKSTARQHDQKRKRKNRAL